VTEDRRAFAASCGARDRERQLGTGYGFGIFVDGRFAGAINLSSIQRGPFQNAYVGYWIDEAQAGKGYVPEEAVALNYLEINGVWEDHIRYAITAEEWASRRAELLKEWIEPG